MPSSAQAIYFATAKAGNFEYVFLVRNTSSPNFDVYAAMIGAQYLVPLGAGPLQNIVPVSAPAGWSLTPSGPPYGFASAGTSWAGSPQASGYVMPGDIGAFVFESSNPAPKTLPFGCCFYNGANEWGFAYDGTAELVDCVPPSDFPRFWDRPAASIPLPSLAHLPGGTPMRGTTSRTLRVGDDGPSLTVTYDRYNNIVRMAQNHPADRVAAVPRQ